MVSISDTSGPTSARPGDEGRGPTGRSGDEWARYQIDGGDGYDAGEYETPNPSPDPIQTEQPAPGPFDGAEADSEFRACSLYVYTEEWHTMEDERVCPECGPLDGKWFEQKMGPQAPLHDHCRCWREVVWWDCYRSDGSYGGGGRV